MYKASLSDSCALYQSDTSKAQSSTLQVEQDDTRIRHPRVTDEPHEKMPAHFVLLLICQCQGTCSKRSWRKRCRSTCLMRTTQQTPRKALNVKVYMQNSSEEEEEEKQNKH